MKIFVIIIAVIIAVLLEVFLSRRSLDGLAAEVFTDTDSAEPDEKFFITLKIVNNTKFIYPFVHYTIILPNTVEVEPGHRVISIPATSIGIIGSAVIWPKRSLEKRIEISCSRRGSCRMGHVDLEVGDFLGIKTRKIEFSRFKTVAIFPHPADTAETEETLGSVMGDFSVRRYIYEDPVLISGFREYSGREPMKSISWMQSARTGQLMVKQYDHTSEMSVSVVLSTDGASPEQGEKCFSLSRSICEQLDSKGIEYDFFMNSIIGGINCSQHYFVKGLGARHLKGILLQLAQADYVCAFSGEDLVNRVLSGNEMAPGIIFICPERNEENAALAGKFSENPAVTVNVVYAEDNSAELSDEQEEAV